VKFPAVAGYSGTPLPKKLGIDAGDRLAVVSAPRGYPKALGPLPPDVLVRDSARGRNDVIVFFAARRAELARRFDAFARALVDDGGLWIAWPKKSSGVITDLDEDTIRQIGLAAGLVDNKVCAIDDTWSGLRFVHRVDRRGAHRRNHRNR